MSAVADDDIKMTEAAMPKLPPPSGDVLFDGNPMDLDRVLGSVALNFLLHPVIFGPGSDGVKCAFLSQHFRGRALDWVTGTLAKHSDWMNDYDGFVARVRVHFAYDESSERALAQTRLGALHQTGDFLEFITEFDSCCDTLGIYSDASKITMLLPKLSRSNYDCLTMQGMVISDYAQTRRRLLNIWTRLPPRASPVENQRKKKQCGKCGKRGHTATQCRSTN